MSLAKSLSELPEYAQVLGNLIARDLKVKYQTKALGFLWSLVYPTIMLGIWYVIFSRAFRIQVPNYWAFLIAGMLPFQFLQSSIAEGSGAVRRNAGLVRKIYVPLEIFVIAGLTAKLIEFLLQLCVAIALLLALHHAGEVRIDPLRTLLVLPPAILLLYVFVLGVALPLSAWTIIYRDLEHMVSLMMTALFYVTPIFWSLELMRDRPWLRWLALNPALNFVELFRGPLYWGRWPANGALNGGAWQAWAIAAAFAMLSFLLGYTLFDRSKRILAEVV